MHINFGGLQSPNFKYINIYYENFGKLKFLPLKYRSIANISLCHLNHFYYINRFFFFGCVRTHTKLMTLIFNGAILQFLGSVKNLTFFFFLV